MPIVTPCYSIKANRLIVFNRVEYNRSKPITQPKTNKRTSNGLSKKSTARITEQVNLLFSCSRNKTIYDTKTEKYFSFKLNFITLTLPTKQKHTDEYIHKNIFLKFIRKLKNKYTGFMYIYKAEVQDNGNLHYHITTNTYIHWETLRNTWNKYLSLENYIDKQVNPNPNSTDIKAIKNPTILGAYIAKYMSKKDIYSRILKRYHKIYDKYHKSNTEQINIPKNYYKHLKRRVNIKPYDCSNCLKGVKHIVYNYGMQERQEIEQIRATHSRIEIDYATIYTGVKYPANNTPILKEEYYNMIAEIISNDRQQKAYQQI